MRIVVLRAFLGADLAGEDACFEQRLDHRRVAVRAPRRDRADRLTDIRTVRAFADAFGHVAFFRVARIDAGDYGYCDETGEPIGVGRLLARPTATLSLEAQQRRELKQKMYGD